MVVTTQIQNDIEAKKLEKEIKRLKEENKRLLEQLNGL